MITIKLGLKYIPTSDTSVFHIATRACVHCTVHIKLFTFYSKHNHYALTLPLTQSSGQNEVERNCRFQDLKKVLKL